MPTRRPRWSAPVVLAGLAVGALSESGCHTVRPTSAPATAPASADGRHADPDSVRLVTQDISNFWRAVDQAAGRDSAERVRVVEEVYLRPGTPGLRDWARVRLMTWNVVRLRLAAAGWTDARLTAARALPPGAPLRDSLARALAPLAAHSAAEELVAALAQYPRYYAAVRANTLALDTSAAVTGEIRRGLRRLSRLYPEARFPDVYFLIGKLSTGGTTADAGMLIGTEQFSSDAATPVDELPTYFGEILKANRAAQLPGLVVHEAVHTLQQGRQGPPTLLSQALGEGVADFVSELAVGPWHAETPRQRYGRAHERAVWLDFERDLAAGNPSAIYTWMYNGRVPAPRNHGATDVGYWVGYAIAKRYYERAADQRAALRELLVMPDPERVLRESGYAAYAEALP